MGFAIFFDISSKKMAMAANRISSRFVNRWFEIIHFYDFDGFAVSSGTSCRVPSATKNLFLKKKVRETEGFSGTFQKDFFASRARLRLC